MHLLSPAVSRYVLLVLDDRAETIVSRLRGAPLAAEVVICTSPEQAWSALVSGRRYSAVIAHAVDPELADAAARVATPWLAVGRAWPAAQLASAIGAVATPIPLADQPPRLGPVPVLGSSALGSRCDGRLVAVCGPGGTGTSTVAASLAVGFGSRTDSCPEGRSVAGPSQRSRAADQPPTSSPPFSSTEPHHVWAHREKKAPTADKGATNRTTPPASADRPERSRLGPPAAGCATTSALSPPATACPAAPPSAGRPAAGTYGVQVLLADFALRADHGFLNGQAESTSGLLHLLEACRYRPITAADARHHTVAFAGCRLLPGLHRRSHWTAVGPAGFDAVLAGLIAMFDLVVADITGDFEGEAETGSFDIEERNHMARRSATAADVVIVVGRPGANGTRRLAAVINDLLDLGVDPARIQPVIIQVGPEAARVCGLPAIPIAVPMLASARDALLPPEAAQPVVTAVAELLARLPLPYRQTTLIPVTPGSLGCLAP